MKSVLLVIVERLTDFLSKPGHLHSWEKAGNCDFEIDERELGFSYRMLC